MGKKEIKRRNVDGGIILRLNLLGLIVFSLSLVVTGALLVLGGMTRVSAHSKNTHNGDSPQQPDGATLFPPGDSRATRASAPWGELVVSDITIERPEEYISPEIKRSQPPAWSFGPMREPEVRNLMLNCGLSPQQTDHALAPALLSVTPTNTSILPDEALILSLSPEVRARFYHELARLPDNHYMEFPFLVPGNNTDAWFAGSKVDEAVVAKVKSLVYPRGSGLCFSDFDLLMRGLPDEPQRLQVAKTLSRQSALLVHLHIRPDTDLQKILEYWGRGLQIKETLPLLESLQRLPEGENISLLYLLPRFARQRLYTYPEPPQPNAPAIDCHWSTMNFFNDPPDNRFASTKFTAQFLRANYYSVPQPTRYGDVVLVLNAEGNIIHSATYLAEDIVFTKNGNNSSQPWTLMRLKDLLANYAFDGGPPKVEVYRNKNPQYSGN
jgi:hypothetical protein